MNGGVVERLMATGCKPVDLRVYAGSNPAPSKDYLSLVQAWPGLELHRLLKIEIIGVLVRERE